MQYMYSKTIKQKIWNKEFFCVHPKDFAPPIPKNPYFDKISFYLWIWIDIKFFFSPANIKTIFRVLIAEIFQYKNLKGWKFTFWYPIFIFFFDYQIYFLYDLILTPK